MSSSNDLSESFFSIPLSTFRNRDVSLAPFPYGMLISAIAIIFFRTTVQFEIPSATGKEPKFLRWFFGVLLAFLSYQNRSYELILAVEIFSYLVPICLFSDYVPSLFLNFAQDKNKTNMLRIVLIAISAILCLMVCHLAATGALFLFIKSITPTFVTDALMVIFPIPEIQAAYDIMDHFIQEEGLLQDQVARLFFITFHIQIAIGYLGIDFLKKEQNRRNTLVRMDIDVTDEDEDEIDKTPGSDYNETATTSTTKDTPLTEKSLQQKKKKSKMNKKAHRFKRTALPFILYTASPYMVEIIAYGNLNAFAFVCFKDDVHRAVRLYDLFDHDNYLVALADHSAKSPADFAGYMDTIVTTTYDIFNRKIFSLPKIALLPMVMAKQPMMIAQIFPIIFATDWLKGKAISYMTHRIEELEKDVQELNAVRSKVEQFDMKNSELLQRAGPGAIDFTKRRWQDMTVRIQMKMVVSSLVTRTKGFFSFIQRNFVFSVLVDCALAELMAAGKLVAAEIFVFSRAIEDFIDMVLMRSRSEAELARMMTQIDNLKELSEVWDAAEQRNLLPCNLGTKNHGDDPSEPLVVFKNLLYSRGTAVVQINHIELPAGVYALTGGNGSGKSTLFRVIMSCNTNDRPIDIPPSILLSMPAEEVLAEGDVIEGEISDGVIEEDVVKVTDSLTKTDRLLSSEDIASQFSISMPSSSVVEISQTFYWPLYSKPIDWIYQHSSAETITEKQMQDRRQRVAELLYSLEFSQSLESEEDIAGNDSVTDSRKLSVEEPDSNGIVTSSTSGDTIARIMDELEEEKEDWFNDLSGGQKSKVELVRKVFLMDECPHVLLIDETMAPLDPRSKSLVMAKIKSFCAGSVVLVIYHTDVGRDKESEESGEVIECVPSNDFFDGNIHVEDKMMHLRPVC